MSTKSPPSKTTKGNDQSTFKLDKHSIIVWRRILLVRYFQILGEAENVNIQWKDFDSKSRLIIINDESKKFEWQLPESLAKSLINISINRTKLCTITLFYTTFTALVQGKNSDLWFQREYKTLADLASKIVKSKGDNSDLKVDSLIKQIDSPQRFLDDIPESLGIYTNNDEGKLDALEINVNNKKQGQEADEPKNTTGTCTSKSTTSETISTEIKCNQQSLENKDSELSNIKKVLHLIELKLIDNDKKSSQILKVCNEMNEKFSAEISSVKQDIAKLNKSVRSEDPKISECVLDITENIKAQEHKFENFQKESKLLVDKLEGTQKILVQSIHAANMTKVLEKIQESKTQSTENSQKLEKIIAQSVEIVDKIDKTKMIDKREEVCSDNQHTCSTADTNTVGANERNKNDRRRTSASNAQETAGQNFNPQMSSNRNKANLWIIGSSIVKDLDGRRMYKNKITRINTLRDKTVYGAAQFIKLEKISAENVIFQIGSNDLDSKEPDDVLQEVENLVEITKQILPNANIILAEILPRFYRDRNLSDKYEEKRQRYNILLKDYCHDKDIEIVTYSNMRVSDYSDGIHLNERGIGVMVKSVKNVINPLLGISASTTENSINQSKNSSVNTYRQAYMHNNYPENGHRENFRYQNRNDNYRSYPDFGHKDNFRNQFRSENHRMADINHQPWNRQDYKWNAQKTHGGYNNNNNLVPILEIMLQEIRNGRY